MSLIKYPRIFIFLLILLLTFSLNALNLKELLIECLCWSFLGIIGLSEFGRLSYKESNTVQDGKDQLYFVFFF